MSSPSSPSAAALLQQGKPAEALAAFEARLAVKPADVEALFGHATALKLLGRHAEARTGYDKVLFLRPDAAGALANRGEVRLNLGQPQEALADFDSAVAFRPSLAPALLGRGVALIRLNRHAEALASLDAALLQLPDSSDAHFHRGLALQYLGDPQSAITAYEKAIALEPDHAFAAINNRSVCLHRLRRFGDGARGYAWLEQSAPGNPISLNGLAISSVHACDWSQDYGPRLAEAVRDGKGEIQPGTLMEYSNDPALMLACARNFLKDKLPLPVSLKRGRPFSGAKIRLAYVSADFHSHATSRLMADVFERHDRTRFDVAGISFGPDDASPMRRRVVKAFDTFHDVRFKSDADTAALIARLGADIAIDLKGLTSDVRIGIFSLRPAPVQVNYLGYPGTLGADFMDYIIGDAIVTPLAQQQFYAEKIVQLPGCYQPQDSTRPLPEAPSRARAGLPPDGFVFCCFNNNWKIRSNLFDVWMRLLAAVPGSLLWLIEDSEEASANLRKEAEARGVDPARLVFAPRVDPDTHLARHRLADLFLDTLPYNAHTTASDALWAGVPVVTSLGAGFPGRVAASILTAAELPELVTENLEDYESLALALAKDAPRLAALKVKVETARNTAPLFDTARFTRNLEAAYEKMRDDFGN